VFPHSNEGGCLILSCMSACIFYPSFLIVHPAPGLPRAPEEEGEVVVVVVEEKEKEKEKEKE